MQMAVISAVPYHPTVFFDTRHSAATFRRGHSRTASIARLDYIVTLIGESERILPHAIARKFEMSSSGAPVAPTEGSTRPVSVIVTWDRGRRAIRSADAVTRRQSSAPFSPFAPMRGLVLACSTISGLV
jgi:hypothetical protein